jgi:hypothetical protein
LHLPVRVSGLAGRRTEPRIAAPSNEAHPGIVVERTALDWLAGDGKLVGERFIPLRYFNGQAATDFPRE